MIAKKLKWILFFLCLSIGLYADDGLVSMDIRKVDVVEVVQLLANSAHLNIVIPEDLEGEVSVKLDKVYWEDALDSILRTKGYGYRKQGNVVRIDALANLKSALATRVFTLKYVDAVDVKPFLMGVLSEQGKINTLTETGRSAYSMGNSVGKQSKEEGTIGKKSRILSITDSEEILNAASQIIEAIDVEPRQISIEVEIVEVTHSKAKQVGIDWNVQAGLTGAKQPLTFPFPAGAIGGPFIPKGSSFPPTQSSDFTFGTLDASKLGATLRLIESHGEVNVLSSPKITTLNNLEASILIGEKFPITTESIDAETGLRTVTLDHYEDIGIQLIVIPQISGGNAINMIIHPAVSSLGDLVDNRYPRINTREADTQILVEDNATIAIGGLLQDRDVDNLRKVPFLGSVPILKYLFRHKETSTQKVELIIFVTPHIVNGASNNQELNRESVVKNLPEDLDKKPELKSDWPKAEQAAKKRVSKHVKRRK